MSPTHKLLIAVSVALFATSCSPKHQASQQQQTSNAGANTTTSAGTTETAENAPRLRVACADDIQKYCANDPHKRRCLRDNMDKLSDACKTAVNAPRGNAGGRGLARVCADEVQKFCANDQHKFRCLKTNLSQLGDTCKAAVTAREQQKAAGKPADDDQ